VSLYGIESEQDCRDRIDELLESPALNGTVSKETVAALKTRLAELYREGTSARGQGQMSTVEQAYFWAAIQEAYPKSPKINAPSTWEGGLYDIADYLRHYRPK
jgi:hypothetical protein